MQHLTAIHMFHRYLVLVLGILLLYAIWRCAVGPPDRGAVRWLAWLTVAAFAGHVIIGAATIWLDFQPHWRALPPDGGDRGVERRCCVGDCRVFVCPHDWRQGHRQRGGGNRRGG